MVESRRRDVYDSLPPFAIWKVIWKKGAFRDKITTFHIGLSNHCSVKGDKVFHLYLDCDDVKLSTVFNGIDLLRERFPELTNAKFLILMTSPFHFSIACFARMSWKRYLKILWYAVELGIEHEGHAAYSMSKGYAVLRTGAQFGVVPRIVFETGDEICCETCMEELIEDINEE